MDIASLIVSCTGLLAAVGGFIQWQRGRRDTLTQQSAANVIQSRTQDHEEIVETNRLLREENARLRETNREDRADFEERVRRIQAACSSVQAASTALLVRVKDALKNEIERSAITTQLRLNREHSDLEHDYEENQP